MSEQVVHIIRREDDSEVEAKFRRLSTGVLSDSKCDRVLELVWSLEQLPNMEDLFDSLIAQV